MSPRDAAAATTYFAQRDAPEARSATSTPAGMTERGRLLATAGSRGLRVQACDNCHGPDGAGEPPAIPYLAGQGASYLMATLNAWRAGTRRNDAGMQMAVIARALTPEATVDVARYYSNLSAPPPESIEQVRSPPPRGQFVGREAEAVGTPDAGADSGIAGIRRLPAADLTTADPAKGHAILASGLHGCAACHSIPGIRGANGVVGPPLGGMAQRGFIAGQLPNRAAVLVAFLLDPPALVPSTGMPDTGLSREAALDIAAYLYTLEP
jgi:cytochrome c553